jgi:hypothetical protein
LYFSSISKNAYMFKQFRLLSNFRQRNKIKPTGYIRSALEVREVGNFQNLDSVPQLLLQISRDPSPVGIFQ